MIDDDLKSRDGGPLTPEESLRVIARAMLEIRQDMRVLGAAVSAQEETNAQAFKRDAALDGRLGRLAGQLEDLAPRIEHIERTQVVSLERLARIEQNMEGVVELTKSTFDIVTEIKSGLAGSGGVDGKIASTESAVAAR